MKRIAVLVCICLFFICSFHVFAQQKAEQVLIQKQLPTTIILVRHAEKEADGSKDPPLTEVGHERARALARMFSLLTPDAIYSSNYRRSMSTAKPLAEQKELSIQVYDPGKQELFLDKVISDHQGGTVVVVGHSNTVPTAVNYLLKQRVIEDMQETEYDKVFVISVLPDGTAKLLPLLLEL